MTHLNAHTQAYLAVEARNELANSETIIKELQIENTYLKREVQEKEELISSLRERNYK